MILVLKRLIINSTPWYQRRGISSNLSRPCLSFKNAFATIKMLKSRSVRGEPVSGPSNFPPPLMITRLYNLSNEHVVPIFRRKIVSIGENFPADVIRLDICPREDETKFRLSFDRNIVSLLEDKIREIRYYFPLLIFPSRWIEKRKKWNSPEKTAFILVVPSWKIRTVNWKTDSDFEKCFENRVEKWRNDCARGDINFKISKKNNMKRIFYFLCHRQIEMQREK